MLLISMTMTKYDLKSRVGECEWIDVPNTFDALYEHLLKEIINIEKARETEGWREKEEWERGGQKEIERQRETKGIWLILK